MMDKAGTLVHEQDGVDSLYRKILKEACQKHNKERPASDVTAQYDTARTANTRMLAHKQQFDSQVYLDHDKPVFGAITATEVPCRHKAWLYMTTSQNTLICHYCLMCRVSNTG